LGDGVACGPADGAFASPSAVFWESGEGGVRWTMRRALRVSVGWALE
jgi:hypothetical protein